MRIKTIWWGAQPTAALPQVQHLADELQKALVADDRTALRFVLYTALLLAEFGFVQVRAPAVLSDQAF